MPGVLPLICETCHGEGFVELCQLKERVEALEANTKPERKIE